MFYFVLKSSVLKRHKFGANLSNFSQFHKNYILLQIWKGFSKFVDYFAYGKNAGKYQD